MGNNNHNSTFAFAKLFLLMGIPFFGQVFTFILAFSNEVDYELKALARGMLIAQVVFITVLVIGIILYFYSLLPILSNIMDKLEILRILTL